MTHPNDMTAWPEIRCQQGHTEHLSHVVEVDLSREHGYHDYPQVPARLARQFRMAVWDWVDYAEVEGYCPSHDAVSETIDMLGIWEPCETIITLSAMMAAAPDSIFVDFGAQIGWFSMLAASTGHDVVAFEADPDCVELVERNAQLNGWEDRVTVVNGRIHSNMGRAKMGQQRVALAKIDIEGAEADAVEYLWDEIEAGNVDHLLIEISPVFNDSYPDLVVRLLEAGYEAWMMPDKATPPVTFEKFPEDLESSRLWPLGLKLRRAMSSEWEGLDYVRRDVTEWHQRNVLFSRPGAPI